MLTYVIAQHRVVLRAVIVAALPTIICVAAAPIAYADELRADSLRNKSSKEISQLIRSHNADELNRTAHELAAAGDADATRRFFFQGWMQTDPDAAIKAALALTDAHTRETVLRAMTEAATAQAAGRLASALKSVPADALGDVRHELIANATQKWAEAEPAAAIASLTDNRETAGGEDDERSTDSSMLVSQIVSTWARRDPAAAIAWAEKHPDARGARQGAIAGWWEKDPDAAEAYALAHLDTPEESKMAGVVANRIALKDPRRAAKWIARLPADARSGAILHVAVPWAHQAPAEAAEWAMNLPPEDRADALGAVASQWARNDPQAVGRWLASIHGPARDQVIATFAVAGTPADPKTAVSWAATIADPTMRDRATEQIVALWTVIDAKSARDWVEHSTFSPERKSQLLHAVPGG